MNKSMKAKKVTEIQTPRHVKIRPLRAADEAELQKFCETCADYCMMVTGRLPQEGDAHNILYDLPPGKKPEDKIVYGMLKSGLKIIGVLDMVRDYRISGEWTIGLMILRPDERGQGLGRQLFGFAKHRILQENGHSIRLGVLEENYRARLFWHSLGFRETEIVKRRYEGKDHRVVIMKLPLQQ
jgi:ribosomal protein S18 acetylase RimI-like enzyme